MEVSEEGQVTIPEYIREFLGIAPHSQVEFVVRDGVVVFKPSEPAEPQKPVKRRFDHLYGTMKGEFTTDEIMEMTRGE